MAEQGIYRKTDKGRDEIATRANKLGLRERTMLIMVDDKTSRAGLLAKNSHPTSEGILDDLLAGGYIEIVGGTVTAASAPPPSAPAPVQAAPAPAPVQAPAAPAPVQAAPAAAAAPGAAAPSAAPPSLPGAAAAGSSLDLDSAAPAAPPVEVSMQSASRYACRALVTLLGPGADDLTALIEKCKTVEELTARLEKCRDVVQGMSGRRKAEEFWAGASARLPKA